MDSELRQNISRNDLMKIANQLEKNYISKEMMMFLPIDPSKINQRFLTDYCKSIDIYYENLSLYNATLFTFPIREYLNYIFYKIFGKAFEIPSICEKDL